MKPWMLVAATTFFVSLAMAVVDGGIPMMLKLR
jgi:hypothetical protein